MFPLIGAVILAGCERGFTGRDIAGAVMPSVTAGAKYPEVMAANPVPPPGKGRLFVYRTAASTETHADPLLGTVEKTVTCVLDQEIIFLASTAFIVRDLTPGPHEVSCHDVRSSRSPSQGIGFRKGTQSLALSTVTGASAFVRIDPRDGKDTPVSVDPSEAVREIRPSTLMNPGLLERIPFRTRVLDALIP